MKNLAILAAAIFLCGCGHVTVPRGTRVGTIIKCADEGWWIKTHEIEVVRGGMTAASGGFGVKPFFATVTDEDTWLQAKNFYDSQTEVEIGYMEKWGSFWDSECAGEDEACAFVTSIKARVPGEK